MPEKKKIEFEGEVLEAHKDCFVLNWKRKLREYFLRIFKRPQPFKEGDKVKITIEKVD